MTTPKDTLARDILDIWDQSPGMSAISPDHKDLFMQRLLSYIVRRDYKIREHYETKATEVKPD